MPSMDVSKVFIPPNAAKLFCPIYNDAKIFENHLNPGHVGIAWIARWVLSDEYPCDRVSIIFHVFLQDFVLTKLATISIRVKLVVFKNYLISLSTTGA